MVTLRLGHSLFAALMLPPALGGMVACLYLAVSLESLPAAVCALLCAVAAGRLVWVLVRRHGQRPANEVVVMGGLGGAAVTHPAFITFARHSKGMWGRQGLVMIAEEGGVFLPMGGAMPLLLEFFLTALVPRVRFADVSFEIGGTSPDAMAEAAARHGGMVLGPDWYWNDAMRWLHRTPEDGMLVLDQVPEGRMGLFKVAPKPTTAELGHTGRKVWLISGLVSAVLLGIGLGAALWKDDWELLFGFGFYAFLVIVATVFGMRMVKRRYREAG